jgi:hypothetical protein
MMNGKNRVMYNQKEPETIRNLLRGELERLLGQGYHTLDIHNGFLAQRAGVLDHLRADAGIGAGNEHVLHDAHALTQDDKGHLLVDRADRLHEAVDEDGAPAALASRSPTLLQAWSDTNFDWISSTGTSP